MLDQTHLYVMAVLFFATLVRSTIGFGQTLVGLPLLALKIPVAIAVPLMGLLSVAIAAVIIVQDWREIEVRSNIWLIISSLFGIPLGLVILTQLDGQMSKAILGGVIVLFAAYSLIFKTTLHLKKDHPTWLIGSGFIAGILGGAYGIYGPPVVIYGSLRQWSPQHFRATLQGYFLIVSIIGTLGYVYVGLWNMTVVWYFVDATAGMLVAIIIGRAINNRLQGNQFFQLVYIGLLVTGGMLVVQSLW